MSLGMVVTLIRGSIFEILLLSAPVLLVALVVGLVVAIFQATTSIQEQTLTLFPKSWRFSACSPRFSAAGCSHLLLASTRSICFSLIPRDVVRQQTTPLPSVIAQAPIFFLVAARQFSP